MAKKDLDIQDVFLFVSFYQLFFVNSSFHFSEIASESVSSNKKSEL